MNSSSKSSSEPILAKAQYLPPPPRLVRSFRCDFRPIPYFLQDLLADATCQRCPDHQSRIVDLIKNIQTYSKIDSGSEGRLWFEINRILKKDLLADHQTFSDGRGVRNYLLDHIMPKHEADFGLPLEVSPISPRVLFISHFKLKGEKFENMASPFLKAPLLPIRQTSS